MTEQSQERSESAMRLIDAGTDITGSAIGAVAGMLVAGPPGVVAGSILGPTLSHAFRNIGHEIRQRRLAPREHARMGAVFTYALARIDEQIKAGRKLRDDEFVKDTPDQRSAAQEILEGVLLHAQREYEEKKIRFYGNLLANIAFDPVADRAMANQLLKLAERLSYRQICLLSLLAQKSKFALRQQDYRNVVKPAPELDSVLQDMYDMYNQGLIGIDYFAMASQYDIIPTKMVFARVGRALCNMMELGTIEPADVEHLAEILRS